MCRGPTRRGEDPGWLPREPVWAFAIASAMIPTAMATTQLPVGATNLPLALTPLIGRGHELESIEEILGRKRAFVIGCVIYGCGSFMTALSPSLPVLILGWSVLEGVGAALILPAIVALVASNFPPEGRPRAYGLVVSAGAIAVAAGPLIGGLFTSYASWRWVFAGEVLLVLAILALSRRITDTPPHARRQLDLIGTALSALGLGLVVFAVLKAGAWGFVQPKPEAPRWLGLSPTIWLGLGGGLTLLLFLRWESHRLKSGREALIDPSMLRNRTLRGGLTAFFFQYLLQAGLFFAVPLFLSVALGLSAIETGVRLLPLSVTLLLAAVGVPKLFPNVSPRRVVRLGFLGLFAGIATLVAALDAGAGAEIVTWPMLLAGLGIGALASQLGSVTVSSVPDQRSGEVGGLQNTLTNLGASIGTALSGAVLIAALTTSLMTGIKNNPAIPSDVKSKASTHLSAGVPFVSDNDLRKALEQAQIPKSTADAIVAENQTARIAALRTSLSIIAILALVALLLSQSIPTQQPAEARANAPPEQVTR